MDLGGLYKIEDPVKKRAVFVALLSAEILKQGGKPPVVVGGEAVEIYTQGSYTTGDIDILSEPEMTGAILKEWGFVKAGRLWLNKDLDIYIDWRGGGLEGGKEPETVKVGDLEVRLISIEDLIIDRLNAAKWWGDADSLMWAKVLINMKRALGGMDEDYLKARAKQEDIADVLMSALGG